MRKIGFILFWLAFLTITAAAQQQVVEPGRAEELKGVTRVYVSASNNEARNIIAEIRKRLPQLTITERSEQAEVWLLFSAQRRSFSKTNPDLDATRTSGSAVAYEIVASGSVIKPVGKSSSHRLVDFKDTTETTMPFGEQDLSTKFAKAFVKSYRKANP